MTSLAQSQCQAVSQQTRGHTGTGVCEPSSIRGPAYDKTGLHRGRLSWNVPVHSSFRSGLSPPVSWLKRSLPFLAQEHFNASSSADQFEYVVATAGRLNTGARVPSGRKGLFLSLSSCEESICCSHSASCSREK